jgi:Zn-dependent peptidase ImmA (M78 family)
LQEETKTPVSSFYYRKRASVSKKALSKFEASVNIVRLGLDKLLAEIEMEDFSFPQIDVGIHNTPAEAARALRQFLKIPKGPIHDLITVIENHGVLVYFVDVEEDGIDGLTVFTDKGRPVMFINQNYPNDRKKFTIAHELGHLVMHIPFVLETWRNEELEANQFASEFLMPEADCRNDFYRFKFMSLGEIKSYWGISKSAIIRRAYDLDVISKETYTYMNIELGRRGERKIEKGFVSLDEPKLLKEMLNVYLEDLSYAKSDLAKVVCQSEKDFVDNFIDMGKKKFKVTFGNKAA